MLQNKLQWSNLLHMYIRLNSTHNEIDQEFEGLGCMVTFMGQAGIKMIVHTHRIKEE